MKKFLSILIVPLAAVLMLCGCGKTQRTVKEITNLIEVNVGAYNEANINANSKYNNWYFLNDSFIMRVVYDNEAQLNDLVHGINEDSTDDLSYKYNQIRTVYERELALIYSYYNSYQKSFYELAESKNVTSEELTNLYDKAKALFNQLSNFNSRKIDFEREVKLYGNSSKILIASIDKFNCAYNALVKSSLEFVEYFRDLHYNYFFKDVNIYDVIYVNQLYYDSLLSLARYIYNDYLMPLEKNGVVSLIDLRDAKYTEYNILGSDAFNRIVTAENVEDNTFGTVKKSYKVVGVSNIGSGFQLALSPDNTNETLKTKAQDKIKQFETSLKNFKQYYQLYLKSFSAINIEKYYDYRYARNGITGTYENSLSDTSEKDIVEKANVQVVHNFEKEKVNSFLTAIKGIINY